MASSALPRAAALFLLLAPLLASAQSSISMPPSSAPTASPADEHLHPNSTPADALAPSQPPSEASAAAALSPPEPSHTSPLPAPTESPVPHSAASAPAPSAAKDEGDGDDDKEKEKEEHSSTPAPAAAAAAAAGDKAEEDGETERHGDELNGGKKAGVVVGAFSAAAVVGLAAFVWKKRQANIRRSRYADYSARLELV